MRQTRGHAALAAFGALTIWFALVQAITLGVSTLGLTLSRAVAIGGLIVSVAAAVAFGLWLVRGGSDARVVDEAGAASGPEAPVALRWIVGLAVAWAASVWLRLWVLASHRPPYSWDGLYYHIPAIHAWTMRGRVAWIGDVPDVPFVNLPMGVEAHTFFMQRIFGASWLVTACDLWFWPLAFLALIVIAGSIGTRVPWRCLAGALFAGIPVVVSQSVTTYTDPAFASTVMAALAAAVVFVAGDGLRPLPRALLFGAALGLMAGAKGTGAPFALVLFVAAFAWALAAHGARAWRSWLGWMALAAVVALAVGGYWYVRNAIHSGNPIYPIRLVFGAKVLAPGYDHVAFSEANLPAWLARFPAFLRMPVSWLELDQPIAGYAPVGGLGFVWLVGLVAALFMIWRGLRQALRRRHDPSVEGPSSHGALLFLAVAMILLLSVQTATWWSRFTIWLHALGLTALVLALQWWYGRVAAAAGPAGVPRWRITLLPVAGLIAVVALTAFESERTLAIEWNTGRLAAHGAAHARYQTTVERLFPGFAGNPTFERFAEARAVARSRWGSYGTLLGGVLSMPLGQRTITVLPPAPTAKDFDALRARGIVWIVWDEHGAGPVPDSLEERAAERARWHPWRGDTFDVIRMGPP